MAIFDKTYHSLLEKILADGYWYEDPNRKGVKRVEIPSYTLRHEFKDGFPAVTTKKLHFKSVVTELLWFLRGDTNIKYLIYNGCNIWNKDAYNYSHREGYNRTIEDFIEQVKLGNFSGDLGPVYGHQWVNWGNQLSKLIKNLKENPLATDHIVNSWNVDDLDKMALKPCHYSFQITVRPLHKGYGFELHWSQRSTDSTLGTPYNMASYATLALIIERLTGYKALAVQGDLKKVHIYDNQIEAVKEQLNRDTEKHKSPELIFDNPSYKESTDWTKLDMDAFLDELYPEYFELKDYESYPTIKVEMLAYNK